MEFRISIKAARINAELSQKEAAEELTKLMGTPISRQKVAYFERKPMAIPISMADAFSEIYKIPMGAIDYAR